ncbi:hypothetical protein ACODT3_04265 [Streptomyces sp. 4.24]|uniref:hypothetical protein n=1 Tax=Streptomyces tritrimontium TaxID=3406573 RepID=UPI003BB708C2
MDGSELSRQERMILHGIESELRADQLLDRRLRRLRRGILPWAFSWSSARSAVRSSVRFSAWASPGSWTRRHRAGLCAWLLCAACATLLGCAAATSSPPLIWSFAAVWVVSFGCLLRLVIRWCRKTAAAFDDGARGER